MLKKQEHVASMIEAEKHSKRVKGCRTHEGLTSQMKPFEASCANAILPIRPAPLKGLIWSFFRSAPFQGEERDLGIGTDHAYAVSHSSHLLPSNSACALLRTQRILHLADNKVVGRLPGFIGRVTLRHS